MCLGKNLGEKREGERIAPKNAPNAPKIFSVFFFFAIGEFFGGGGGGGLYIFCGCSGCSASDMHLLLLTSTILTSSPTFLVPISVVFLKAF